MTNRKTFSALDLMTLREAPKTNEQTESTEAREQETTDANVKNATFSIPVKLLQLVKYIGVADGQKYSTVVTRAIREYAEKWAAEHGKTIEDMKLL